MKSETIRFRQVILLLGDIVCFVLGLLTALILRYGFPLSEAQILIHRTPYLIIFATWLVVFYVGGMYHLRIAKNKRSFFTVLTSLFALNAGIAVFFFYFIPSFQISPKVVMFLDLLITLVLLIGWRMLFNRFVVRSPIRLAILGAGKEVEELIKDIRSHPQHGYEVVLQQHDVPHDLTQSLLHHHIDAVVVALDYRRSPELQKSLFSCIPLRIQFFNFVDFYELHFQKIPLAVIDTAWFLDNLSDMEKRLSAFAKRIVDVLSALLLGLIGLVFAPFIMLAILAETGRPIFFSQIRTGRYMRPFRIYKFRSMKHDDDEESVTRVGRVLRATHLDEIPQLWNILRGDMSFVGPRPEQQQMVEKFKDQISFYTERLLVRPGITGWAQLHEPHARAEDAVQKLQYDLFYVKHKSFLFDLEIMLKTLRVLLS